jgi:hypothetical protein
LTRVTLLERIDALLVERGVLHALTGASAMVAHGAHPTAGDEELFVTDRRVLDAGFWEPLGPDVSVDVEDAIDAPASAVQLRERDQLVATVVVGRHRWQDDVLARAVLIGGRGLPVAEAADLVLLKLFAGRSQDHAEIEQLLATNHGEEIVPKVEARSALLPLRSRKMWLALRPRPSAP